MDAWQALETIKSRRFIQIDGESDQIDRMLSDLESRLKEKGLTRDFEREARMVGRSNQENQRRYFVGGPDGGPRLLLSLTRVSDRRVRGGIDAIPGEGFWPEATKVALVIEDVMTRVLPASASQFGLNVTYPRLGRFSRVSSNTLAALRAFSDLAAGTWPLSGDQAQQWRRFVIRASREDTAFDIEELSGWFIDNGWSPEDTDALIDKFISDSELISEYEDEVRA